LVKILLFLILFVLSIPLVFAESDYDYLIYKSGNTIYAQNGHTGVVDYQSTDLGYVLNHINSPSNNDGLIYIKSGNYSQYTSFNLLNLTATKKITIQGENLYSTRITLLNNSNWINSFSNTMLDRITIDGSHITNHNVIPLIMNSSYANIGRIWVIGPSISQSTSFMVEGRQAVYANNNYFDNIIISNGDNCFVGLYVTESQFNNITCQGYLQRGILFYGDNNNFGKIDFSPLYPSSNVIDLSLGGLQTSNHTTYANNFNEIAFTPNDISINILDYSSQWNRPNVINHGSIDSPTLNIVCNSNKTCSALKITNFP